MTDDVSDDVTPAASETAAVDPDAPWRFSLRGKQRERAIVQRVIDAHRLQGLEISLNDAVLVLIRRAATPDPDTQEEAQAVIEQHWATCPHGCDAKTWPPRCPEGWRVYDAYQRVLNRHPQPQRAATPAPRRRAFPPFPTTRRRRPDEKETG